MYGGRLLVYSFSFAALPDRLTTLVGRKYCITYVNPLFITASTALIRTHFTSLRTDENSQHRRLTITGSKKVLNYFPLVYIFLVFPPVSSILRRRRFAVTGLYMQADAGLTPKCYYAERSSTLTGGFSTSLSTRFVCACIWSVVCN